ncbi:MAG: SDR family NAD(P)-dependent oxidoreductase [Candidatus Symbiobacter sp.]|nr:SDR family NAD(P)-dependent oxidoreductase [Candidatus Symbiobacter sp.]
MTETNFGLKGKKVVVTGGADGIGRGLALSFAENGADIAIADIHDADEIERQVTSLGRKFLFRHTDVSNPDQVASFGQAVRQEWGHCDVLINNAGIYPMKKFDEMSFDDWREMFAINVDSQFLMAKQFVPLMKEKQWGRIINITSTAFWIKTADLVHYVASKGAIIGFTRALATELGEFGITVNALAPSLVRTHTTETEHLLEKFQTITEQLQAISRLEVPSDLSGAALFFASDHASFITAQVLAVDGGMVRH